MSWSSEPKHIHHSKVKKSCDWCYEWIEKEHPKTTYFSDEGGQVNMHPECFIAMQQWAKMHDWEYELPTRGTYSRGKSVENEVKEQQ